VDLLEIKGRIAVALVEAIFRRAGFALAPVVHAEVAPRQGREDLIPDFQVTLPAAVDGPSLAPRVVEVRYRPQVGQYLLIEAQRGPYSLFTVAKRQWPSLMFVFVTDHPEAGRSCFQVVDLGPWVAGSAVAALDLHAHDELQIFRQNVEEHEMLLRRMFALLTGG
jgi:hypothetical protein